MDSRCDEPGVVKLVAAQRISSHGKPASTELLTAGNSALDLAADPNDRTPRPRGRFALAGDPSRRECEELGAALHFR
jgi:hypothetical protein